MAKGTKKIQAIIEPDTMHRDLTVPFNEFKANPGEYHVIRLDMNGQEIAGSDFSIGDPTFTRTFLPLTQGDNPTHKLKKKNQ